MSAELIVFILTVGTLFVIGIPRVIRRVSLPAQMQLVDVGEAMLTTAQKDIFVQLDISFQRLQMSPRRTFSATNLSGRNINRAYYSSFEPVVAVATFITYLTPEKTETVQNYIEFITEFTDGSTLDTKNSTISTLFVPKPKRVNQSLPGLKSIEELKKFHDQKIPLVSSSPRLTFSPNDLFNKMQKDHAEMCQRQCSHGLLRLNPTTGRYNSTALLALRGIRNYLNPFADNFTWIKLILALVFSIGLPCAVLLAFADTDFKQWLAPMLYPTGMKPMVLQFILLGGCFAVSGVVLGFLLEKEAFIWCFLMGYSSLFFIPGGTDLWCYPLIMSVMVDTVCTVRQKRRKIA